jgi:hypothetical protein
MRNKVKEITTYFSSVLPRSTSSLILLMSSVTVISASYKLDYIKPLFELWFPHIQVGIIAMMLYYLTLSFINLFADNTYESSANRPVARMATEIEKVKCSAKGLMVASCHEVGHAFTLSLLPSDLIPNEINLYINEYESSTVGALSYKYNNHDTANTPDYFYWQIAVSRAGFLAEEYFGIKETALSKTDRIKAWEAAKNYLVFKENDSYFLSPTNDVEAMINHSTISALIKKVDESIIKSFKDNGDLLVEFKDTLLAKMQLDKNEVLSFVNQIK